MAENRRNDRLPMGYAAPDLSDPGSRHEKGDVDVRSIGKFAIGLTLLCIATFALIVGVFRFLQTRTDALQAPRPALPADARRLPPEPRLQSTPIPDLKAMRDAEEQLLNGYAWIDRAAGTARIPVSRAIELLAERGLPARPAAPAAPAVSVPTDSALGLKMQQPAEPAPGVRQTPAPEAPRAEEKKH